MTNQLSYTIRTSAIHEGDLDYIVDFEIDSQSIWSRMKQLAPNQMSIEVTKNPDGGFVGMPIHSVKVLERLYLTGRHEHYKGNWSGLAPLLVCSDCGHEACGGIFTRIAVGSEIVTWSGIGSSCGGDGLASLSDPSVFTFDSLDYDDTLRSLIDEIQILSP